MLKIHNPTRQGTQGKANQFGGCFAALRFPVASRRHLLYHPSVLVLSRVLAQLTSCQTHISGSAMSAVPCPRTYHIWSHKQLLSWMSVTMIFWTEIAAGGSGGSAQALYASRPPTLGSVQHEAYCQLAYQLFSDSPSPLLSCSRPQCPVTARLSSGAWYCWEPVSHAEEHWDGFRLDLRAFPQVLMAWQCGVDCLFLAGSTM